MAGVPPGAPNITLVRKRTPDEHGTTHFLVADKYVYMQVHINVFSGIGISIFSFFFEEDLLLKIHDDSETSDYSIQSTKFDFSLLNVVIVCVRAHLCVRSPKCTLIYESDVEFFFWPSG